jgi:hypothetical protein
LTFENKIVAEDLVVSDAKNGLLKHYFQTVNGWMQNAKKWTQNEAQSTHTKKRRNETRGEVP